MVDDYIHEYSVQTQRRGVCLVTTGWISRKKNIQIQTSIRPSLGRRIAHGLETSIKNTSVKKKWSKICYKEILYNQEILKLYIFLPFYFSPLEKMKRMQFTGPRC